MSVFDHSKQVKNQTMCNEFNFDVLENQKMSGKSAKAPLSQQNTIDRRSASRYHEVFRDVNKIQNKLEKVKLSLIFVEFVQA